MATITLGTNTYTLVPMPATPGFADISISMFDAVAVVESPYVPSQVQTQRWPGADRWTLQFTLPKMHRKYSNSWKGFLAALQGRANVFQAGDPQGKLPQGAAQGAPAVGSFSITFGGVTSSNNAVGTNLLLSTNWKPNIYRQLIAGDYIQVVDRLYMVTAEVDSDAEGLAAIPIWPSLRETPASGTQIKLANTVGVFRLAQNMRSWHTSNDQLTQISVQCVEVR